MKAEQLRKSILQLAIQGKLVPPACRQAGKILSSNPQPHRQGGARQIRHNGGGRPANRTENCRPGAKIRHNDDGRFLSVAFCQRGGVAGHRGNQNRLSRRCRCCLCRFLDDAVAAFAVSLTAEDVALIDEFYLPHKVMGALAP